MTLEILPKPQSQNKNHRETEMWVDEAIWGHRLYDEQTPWLTLLEFLGILQTELEAQRPFIEEVEYNQLNYSSYPRLYLRNILFNNPCLEAVNAEYSTEEDRWKNWLEKITNDCGGILNPDFSYLQERFSSFRDFLEVVKFLQYNAIERDSNKRWSSKFVFPYGVNCLYEDLRVNKDGFSNDRRFFARTGELLYLMISRSHRKLEILDHLREMGVIDNHKSSKWNNLVAALQPNSDANNDTKPRNKGNSIPPYLPYKTLPEFDNLADDWLNLFNCYLPDYDSLPHLVNIMGVHFVIYLLKRAQGILNNDDDIRFESQFFLKDKDNNTLNYEDKPKFILEIVAPKKTIIRNLASDNFLKNNNLSKQAVEHYIQRLSQLSEWQKCLNSATPIEDALDIFKEEVYYDNKNNEIKGNSPEELLQELCQQAIDRHKKHVGQFHNKWAKEIGLASSRGSRQTRYAPTDSLLKTLVLCCVPKRMEFQEFLEIIYQKYGFIIGEKQAIDIINRNEADQEAFQYNRERLEQRLASLGLLKRLSDACAYVFNPYTTEKV